MSPRKCILGGWLLTICLVSIGWSQETDEEPAKPSSKKKPATSSKAKKPSTSKSTKSAKAKREMKARKDHPEPTDKQPELSLDVHDDPVLEDLANQLDELDAQIRKAVSELSEKKAAKGKAAGKEMLEVGEIYADILRMERLASRLSRAGEPLGNDMGFRKSDLLATYNNFFFTYRGLPGVTAQMAALRTALEKESKNREKILPQVEKLCAADKWNEADELLDANLRVLGSFGVYFEPQNLPYASMAVRHKQVDEKLHELIAAAARENATKLQAEQWPQFAELVQQAKEAQTSIRETGTATVESQSLPGPEVIDQLGAK